MNCLTLKDVSYRYQGAKDHVLKKINATFEAGKVYAIVGQSGAGKSTLLSLIAGLDACQEGSITYHGQNLNQIDRDHYRAHHVGVIFQGYNLLVNSTPVYNITLSMSISGISPSKTYAQALLHKVGIDQETTARKILKLSGGEQQRVGIARALAHNPHLIIADEPTGNLDEKTEAEILQILTQLAHQDGKCVIIVTHSDHVSAMADTVYRIADGKLLNED